jgi:hypothetical protein
VALEIKHAKLSRSLRGQQRIVEFLRDATPENKVAVTIWHKEFTLVTTIVDSWVEGSTFGHGIDLYFRGGNIALANVLHHPLSTLLLYQHFRTHLARNVAGPGDNVGA